MERNKELVKEQRGELNLLLIQQAYLVKKQKNSLADVSSLATLHSVQRKIGEWYENRCKKVQVQSQRDEFQLSEQTRIYHHELHKKSIKRNAILKLDTEDEGILQGHDACSNYLQKKLQELLGEPACLDSVSQATLLSGVEEQITEEDNDMFEALPTKDEIFKALSA